MVEKREMKNDVCGGGRSTPKRDLIIDFLYLDLNTCERCMGTDETLESALKDCTGILEILGYQIRLHKVNITSPELAVKYRFFSSPTIRVNGQDICSEVMENNCGDCGDICGDHVDCRTFAYEGQIYERPPKAMIIDGIFRAIYSQKLDVDKTYTIPDNLERFFSGIKIDGSSACCTCGGSCK